MENRLENSSFLLMLQDLIIPSAVSLAVPLALLSLTRYIFLGNESNDLVMKSRKEYASLLLKLCQCLLFVTVK